MKKFAVLSIALLLVLEAYGAAVPGKDDNGLIPKELANLPSDILAGLPGAIEKAVGSVGGIADQLIKLPGELIKLGPDNKDDAGKADNKNASPPLNLGDILKNPLSILG